MPTPRRRSMPRVLVTLAAALGLAVGAAGPAHAAPVVSEVPGGEEVAALVEYEGLLYLGSATGLQHYDGTTFTTIPGAPTHPRDFVEFLGDLWMVGGDPTLDEATLWRLSGGALTQVAAYGASPTVIGGRLYVEAAGTLPGDTVLAWHDGTTLTPAPASPEDVRQVTAGPNGEIVYTSGSPRKLWIFDGTATHAEVPHAGAPVGLDELTTLSGAIAFSAQANPGDPNTAYSWDGATFSQLGAPATDDAGCFVEYAGSLLYAGNDGTARMFSATAGVAGSEAPVVPTVPAGCPRYVASDGTLYLQASPGPGLDPTLHSWDGTSLAVLATVGKFPHDFVEYGGLLYFSAIPVSEIPGLFVLQDVTTTPTGPTLPPTGAEVPPVLVVLAVALVLGGVVVLVVARRRRA